MIEQGKEIDPSSNADSRFIITPTQVEVKHFSKKGTISPNHVFDVLLKVFFKQNWFVIEMSVWNLIYLLRAPNCQKSVIDVSRYILWKSRMIKLFNLSYQRDSYFYKLILRLFSDTVRLLCDVDSSESFDYVADQIWSFSLGLYLFEVC